MSLSVDTEFPPGHASELARMRAIGCLHGLVLAVAFALSTGHTLDELVDFGLGGFEGGGYYDDWAQQHGRGEGALDAFVREFVRGRAMIYDRSEVSLVGDTYRVTSPLWFWAETPEFFFYYGLTPEEFSQYTRRLAEENARRLGIDLTLTYADGQEVAQIRSERLQ